MFLRKSELSDPREILIAFTERLTRNSGARDLDLTSLESSISGRTTYICVSRDRVFDTGTEEIVVADRDGMMDIRVPLEVDFYGEGKYFNLHVMSVFCHYV